MGKSIVEHGGGNEKRKIIEYNITQYFQNLYNWTPKISSFAGAAWIQVYYHDITNGGLWTTSLGDNYDSQYRYSRISFIKIINENFGYDTSKYEYYIDFPQYTTSNYPDYYYRWTQTAVPSNTASGSTGVTQIHCFNDTKFTGIWKSNSSTIYQCSNAGWWNPIEPTSSWSGGSPWRINNAESSAHTIVMYLRINNNKKVSILGPSTQEPPIKIWDGTINTAQDINLNAKISNFIMIGFEHGWDVYKTVVWVPVSLFKTRNSASKVWFESIWDSQAIALYYVNDATIRFSGRWGSDNLYGIWVY